MQLLEPPGVYRPQDDTRLLTDALDEAGIHPGSNVLDVGTGTGALAIAAVRGGAARVTAVDVSARAVVTAWLNALLMPVRVRRGDALLLHYPERFDLVLANPPYVPSAPDRRRARAWDGGPDGRKLVDRICDRAPELLARGGTLLMVHSALADPDATLQRLHRADLKAAVVDRRNQDFGPVLHDRATAFEDSGLIMPGQREEELVVIRGDRTD